MFLIIVCIQYYGAITEWLRHWIPNPQVQGSKPLGGSKVDWAFHLFEVDQMSTREIWGLSGIKKTVSS